MSSITAFAEKKFLVDGVETTFLYTGKIFDGHCQGCGYDHLAVWRLADLTNDGRLRIASGGTAVHCCSACGAVQSQ